jgi:hypothetical protein
VSSRRFVPAGGCLVAVAIAACSGSKVEKEQSSDPEELLAGAGESPGGTPTVFANIEGRPLQFRYGKAYATSDTLHIVLSTEKTACTFAPGTEEAYRIRFELTPGPGGRFFTGTPTGVGANFESRKTRLAITAADPYLVTATVDPFVLKSGSHIRGRLEFDVKLVKTKADRSKQAYQSKGAGFFDVEICDDAGVLAALKGQPPDAPDGEVAGTFAGQRFVFKTAIANVWHDPDNAQDFIDSIVFFPVSGINCANQWDQRDKVNLFMVRSIGGAGSRQRFTGSPQPASASFFIPKLAADVNDATDSIYFFGGGAERAWVRFDKLDFKAGSSVTGTVYADSREGSKIEEEGRIGGRFRAKVCSAD